MSVDGTHHYGVQIDLAALPNEPDVLQQMLREVVPEPYAENHKLWLLIQRRLRHRYGPRSEKLNLDQLQLVLVDAEQSAAEAGAATDAAAPPVRRGALCPPIAIAVPCRRTCRATSSSSISRPRTVPAAVAHCT
jgi:hypothetical protein